MKKNICILLLILICIFTGCTNNSNKLSDGRSVELFFANTELNGLVCESRIVPSDDEILKNAITELLSGPKGDESKTVIPKGTKLVDINVKKRNAEVYLTGSYFYTFSDSLTQTLAIYSIVDTVCNIGDADSVRIYLDGKDIVDFDGNIIGKLNFKSDFSKIQNMIKVSLYFPNNDAKLVKCERKIIKEDNLEKAIVKQLISGPVSDDMLKPFPKGTKIIDVGKENNTCTINFNKKFLANDEGYDIMVEIYSVVNTLTSIDGIDEVMFLIDGDPVEFYGGLEFNVPFEFNSSICVQ